MLMPLKFVPGIDVLGALIGADSGLSISDGKALRVLRISPGTSIVKSILDIDSN